MSQSQPSWDSLPVMSQSQPPWDSLPVLAVKCVFQHLELQDVLAAASTCRHWRSALLIFDGVRSSLNLQIHEDTTKHEMLTRIFKKHLKSLHIYIDTEANETTLNYFTLHILPQFLDSIGLQELIFVGPIYMSQNKSTPYIQLRRVIFETLVYKHAHTLDKLAVFGCGINHLDEDDRYTSKHMAYYSKALSFEPLEYVSPGPHDNSILSRNTVNSMNYSNISHIVFEYELMSTDSLINLSELDNLRLLSLNIMSRSDLYIQRIDWEAATPLFKNGLQVAVNIIALPRHKVEHVIDNAFRKGMPLTSLKVMFCKVFYLTLVHHVTMMYHRTLEEFCWVDRPSRRDRQRRLRMQQQDAPLHQVNPFVYLAWQCKELRKLTIHGYWMCDYDLVGITRLREDIDIDVSAVYDSQADQDQGELHRVMDPAQHTQYKVRLHRNIDGTVNSRTWYNLPAALKSRTSKKECAEYIVSEIMNPLSVT